MFAQLVRLPAASFCRESWESCSDPVHLRSWQTLQGKTACPIFAYFPVVPIFLGFCRSNPGYFGVAPNSNLSALWNYCFLLGLQMPRL